MRWGIDISEWQEDTILDDIKPEFVLIRAGYSLSEDESARYFCRRAHELHIPFGLYWYTTSKAPDRAEAEAAAFLEFVDSLRVKPTLGLWLDIEDPSIAKSDWNDIALSFCRTLEGHGYYVGIYASAANMQHLNKCTEYDKWTADWGINNGQMHSEDRPQSGTLWQFTSKYKGRNLDGDVCLYDDMSFYNLSKPADHDEIVSRLEACLENLYEILEELKDGKIS